MYEYGNGLTFVHTTKYSNQEVSRSIFRCTLIHICRCNQLFKKIRAHGPFSVARTARTARTARYLADCAATMSSKTASRSRCCNTEVVFSSIIDFSDSAVASSLASIIFVKTFPVSFSLCRAALGVIPVRHRDCVTSREHR